MEVSDKGRVGFGAYLAWRSGIVSREHGFGLVGRVVSVQCFQKPQMAIIFNLLQSSCPYSAVENVLRSDKVARTACPNSLR